MSTNQIIRVNGKEIIVISQESEKYVAIRPICEAIGIDYSSQLKKIKDDPILSSVVATITTTGVDKKNYKMQTLRFRYVFGWLFRVDSRKVKEDVRDSVEKYQKECYDALFDIFTKRTSILKEKTNYQIEIDKLESNWKQTDDFKKIAELKQQQKNATQRLNNLDKNIVNEQLDLFKEE